MKALDYKKTMGSIKKEYWYNGIKMRSKIETEFAHHLDLKLIARLIDSWTYEPFSLDIAPALKTRRSYTPDFVVKAKKGLPHIYEIKSWGRHRDKGIARFENAANLYAAQYRFFLVDYSGKNFTIKELK